MKERTKNLANEALHLVATFGGAAEVAEMLTGKQGKVSPYAAKIRSKFWTLKDEKERIERALTELSPEQNNNIHRLMSSLRREELWKYKAFLWYFGGGDFPETKPQKGKSILAEMLEYLADLGDGQIGYLEKDLELFEQYQNQLLNRAKKWLGKKVDPDKVKTLWDNRNGEQGIATRIRRDKEQRDQKLITWLERNERSK